MATSGSYLRDWSAAWLALRQWCRGALAALSRVIHRPPKHPFDRMHRVDTDGLIYADALSTGHEHDRHSAGYYATAPSLFHGAIALWRETLPATARTLSGYTLVDIGCGKGRVVMLASEHEFREVVGIELNPRLAAVARKNLRKWMIRTRACTRVRIIEGDALSTPLPDGPVVLFFFNSFEREMVEMWLAQLAQTAASRTHPIDLIYLHPEFDELVRQVPGIQAMADVQIPFSAEDAAADAFDVAVDRCAMYRMQQ